METKIMPQEPTLAMREAALAALNNPTISNPKAAAWDAIIAYRAMWAVAPMNWAVVPMNGGSDEQD